MNGHQVITGHHFISYSAIEAGDFASRLYIELLAGQPSFSAWLDKEKLRPGEDWDEQIAEAIRTCESLLFVMTPDSVDSQSVVKTEWTRALKYKKPIMPLLLERNAEMPFRLGSRQYIDFTDSFDIGLARLRRHLQWLGSPEGELQTLKYRLQDAQRDLRRADTEEGTRIQDEIEALRQQIAHQERVVENPEQEEARRTESIQTGIERERQPKDPVSGEVRTKFINPPPVIAPSYFQDRHVETLQIGDFLKDDALRLMTVVGRAGIGKTAMVCRLLKSLESGRLPDEGGELSVDGIVYLSERGSRRVSVPFAYADLCELLPDDVAEELDRIYKDPQASIDAKVHALLDAFPEGRYVLLLDNFEDMIDPATREIKEAELKGALRTLLEHPHHAVKVILTTRFAPRPQDLALVRPELQRTLNMDEGLESPYAENILREMDADGTVGLKTASNELLDEARERTRGFPRALEALFAILSADRNTSLREVLDDTKGLLPENVVDVLVGEAFSRLDPVAQMVMQALAIYSYPVTPAAVDYLLLPHRTGGVDSAAVLGRLVNMQFVRREAGRHYYLHPVDRAYALSRVPEGEETDRYVAEAPPFTQIALLNRAADYFEQTRTPRESWKSIEDLARQLQEFELRYAGQDYDAAANVLLEIDFDYLLLWGHFRLVTEMHERLRGKLSDSDLQQSNLGNLGSACNSLGRYREAIAYTEQALEIAREVGDRASEGVWLGNLGNSYNNLGRYQEAIAYTEQALEIAREVGDRQGESASLRNLGDSYNNMGRYRESIAYYEQALEIAREVGDRVGEGGCLNSLGSSYNALGRYREAIAYFEQALEIAREVGDRQSEGAQLGSLGNSYNNMGRYRKSIAHYEQALEIAREVGDRAGEGIRLNNLGNSYANMGQYQEAIAHYEQALEIAREIGDRQGEGVGFGNLANVYVSLGQYQEAIAYYEQALAIDREIGDRQGEGSDLGNLGNAYSSLGQTNQAIDCYEQSLAISREIGDRAGETVTLSNLGDRYADQGQYARAKETYEQSLPVAREIGYRFMESSNLASLGYLFIAQDKWDEAVQQYKQAIQIADEIEYQQWQREARMGLARASLFADDLSTAHSAIEAARRYESQGYNYDLLALMGVIALRTGDSAAAQEAFQAAAAQAEAQLSYSEQVYSALDAKGLTLCGLSLCAGDRDFIAVAMDAYRKAREINRDAGIVAGVLRLFDALKPADSEGMLAEVRAVAAGTEVSST